MTYMEAAVRIDSHINQLKEHKYNAKIVEALKMSIGLLLWANQQPSNLFESDVNEFIALDDVINEYYNQGLRDGYNQAKKIRNIKKY